jgi:hypothetical protein
LQIEEEQMSRRMVIGVLFAAAAAVCAVVLGFQQAGAGSKARSSALPAVLKRCPAGFVGGGGEGTCLPAGAPEGNAVETQLEMLQWASRTTSPFDTVAPGAFPAAVNAAAEVSKTGGAWQQVGSSPLHADSPDYAGPDATFGSGPSRLGWHGLAGRATALAFDPAHPGRILASAAAGGVWESTNDGGSWRSLGDGLPVQAMGGVAFSTANKGTIIAGTGDNAFGGVITPSGFGVYTSRTDGGSWTKAKGLPDGLTTLKIAVDPSNPSVDYVATDKGLYRSTDDGLSHANVNLPTTCTDQSKVSCSFSNVVTDVAVRPADANGKNGGEVIAAVGWEYGQKTTQSGFVMAPQNGIYTSPTGAPGEFSETTTYVPTASLSLEHPTSPKTASPSTFAAAR